MPNWGTNYIGINQSQKDKKGGLMPRDGNFAPPRLTRPSPLHPVRVFPAPQKWWGGDGVRF